MLTQLGRCSLAYLPSCASANSSWPSVYSTLLLLTPKIKVAKGREALTVSTWEELSEILTGTCFVL